MEVTKPMTLDKGDDKSNEPNIYPLHQDPHNLLKKKRII